MNAPLSSTLPLQPDTVADGISLDDKFTLERGRAFMTGTQALVRLPMLQRERDAERRPEHRRLHHRLPRLARPAASTMTAVKAKKHLDAHHVKFHPGHERRPGGDRRLGHAADQPVPGRAIRRRVRHVVRQGPGRRPLRRRLQARQQGRHLQARRRAGAGRRRPCGQVLDHRAPERPHPEGLRHPGAVSRRRCRNTSTTACTAGP